MTYHHDSADCANPLVPTWKCWACGGPLDEAAQLVIGFEALSEAIRRWKLLEDRMLVRWRAVCHGCQPVVDKNDLRWFSPTTVADALALSLSLSRKGWLVHTDWADFAAAGWGLEGEVAA